MDVWGEIEFKVVVVRISGDARYPRDRADAAAAFDF